MSDDFPLPTFTPPSPLPFPQKPTDGVRGSSPLTSRQLSALSLLCSGLTLAQTAARLGLSPRTLHRWRTSHPAFIAELNRRQRDLHDTASRRLRLALRRALELVTYQMDSADYLDDRVKAAQFLLRHCDLPSLLAPPTALTESRVLDDLIRQDWSSRNLDPQRQVDDYDRHQYLLHLPPDESPAPSHTPVAPTHRRLAGTPSTPPEPYPTPSNAPPTPDPTDPTTSP